MLSGPTHFFKTKSENIGELKKEGDGAAYNHPALGN
jgi:hypothetical protein